MCLCLCNRNIAPILSESITSPSRASQLQFWGKQQFAAEKPGANNDPTDDTNDTSHVVTGSIISIHPKLQVLSLNTVVRRVNSGLFEKHDQNI